MCVYVCVCVWGGVLGGGFVCVCVCCMYWRILKPLFWGSGLKILKKGILHFELKLKYVVRR